MFSSKSAGAVRFIKAWGKKRKICIVRGEGKNCSDFSSFVCFLFSFLFFAVCCCCCLSPFAFFPEAFVGILRSLGRETTAMPASNKALAIFRGSTVLLPCLVRFDSSESLLSIITQTCYCRKAHAQSLEIKRD